MKKILICCLACFSVSFSFAQRIPPSRFGKLQLMSRAPGRCYPLYHDRKVGIGYGVHHNLIGLKFHDDVWWKFGLPLNLTTDLEYRPRYRGNGYLNIDLMRVESLRLGRHELGLNTGYKRLLANRTNTNNQFYLGSSFYKRTYGTTLAYAVQYQRSSETSSKYDHGIMLQYYREFFDELDIKVSGIFWFNDIQYSIRLNENPFQSRFSVGLGYEKIGSWDEFDVSVAYIF